MRPELTPSTDPEAFRDYYWLKQELSDFCRRNKLSTSGSKPQLAERIYHFLKTGERLKAPKIRRKPFPGEGELSLEMTVPEGYRSTEKVRMFFCKQIGPDFRFNVPFQAFMKENAGKITFGEAVDEWQNIRERIKDGEKFPILESCEYNRYFRDFFCANPGLSRKDAVRCWKYKREQPGHHYFEESDMKVLKDEE